MYIFPFQPAVGVNANSSAETDQTDASGSEIFAGLLGELLALLAAPAADVAPVTENVSEAEGAVVETDTTEVGDVLDDSEVASPESVAVPIDVVTATSIGPAPKSEGDSEQAVVAQGKGLSFGELRGRIVDLSPKVRSAPVFRVGLPANPPVALVTAPTAEGDHIPVAIQADGSQTPPDSNADGPPAARSVAGEATVRRADSPEQGARVAPLHGAQSRLADAARFERTGAVGPPLRPVAAGEQPAASGEGGQSRHDEAHPPLSARPVVSPAPTDRTTPVPAFEAVQLRAPVQGAEGVRRAPPESQPAQVLTAVEPRSAPIPAQGAEVTMEARGVSEPKALTESAIRGVRHLLTRGEQVITVRLVPESLGELHVTVRHGAESLEVHFASTHDGVRETLQSHLPVMREALARDGIDVTRAVVSSTPPGDLSSNPNGSMPRESFSGHSRTGGGDTPARFISSPRVEPTRLERRHEGALDVLV